MTDEVRSMKRRYRTPVAFLLASAALAAPQPASAQRDREGCFEHLNRSSRVIDETRFGIVFRKRDYVYGCIYSTGRIRRLPGHDPLGPPVTGVGVVRLDGRYAGYALEDEEGGAQVVLYDVKNGTRVFTDSALSRATMTTPNASREPYQVRSIVVKANGTTAWIGQGERKVGEEPIAGGGIRDITEPVIEVVMRGPGDTASRALDAGADIAPRSLAKSSDEMTLFWQRGGAPRSSPLP
jgi:hypothetical protein